MGKTVTLFVIDHYLQEEKCIRNTACNKTSYQSYLPSALVPIATNQKTPNYTSETSRHTSIYRLPLCLFQTVVISFPMFPLITPGKFYHSVSHSSCLLNLFSSLEYARFCVMNLNPCVFYRGSQRVRDQQCSLNVYFSVIQTMTAIHHWWPTFSLELPRAVKGLARNEIQVFLERKNRIGIARHSILFGTTHRHIKGLLT